MKKIARTSENERKKESTIRLAPNTLTWIYNYHNYRNASPDASHLLVKRTINTTH